MQIKDTQPDKRAKLMKDINIQRNKAQARITKL